MKSKRNVVVKSTKKKALKKGAKKIVKVKDTDKDGY